MREQRHEDKKAWIEALIRDFCASPQNTLAMPTGEPAWAAPLIAYARGDDPLFTTLKINANSLR